MSESIDFRINDYIYEYLDYKGYKNTVETFLQERSNRKESINKTTYKSLSDKEKEKNKIIKVFIINKKKLFYLMIIFYLFIYIGRFFKTS